MAIQRSLPSTINADSTSTVVLPSRTSKYLEAYVVPMGLKQQVFADEGSYFTAYNVTDGTGIAGHAAPVQADLSTKPLLHIFNGSTTKTISIDYVKLRMTAIGAGATTTDFTFWIDQNGSTVKTGGTSTVATSVNCRSDQPYTTGAIVSFGVVTASAAATEKRIGHQRVRSVVAVVEDQYVFSFGNPGYAMPAAMALTGTAVVSAFVHCPPAVILPGGNFKLVQWGASQSGAHSFEYSVGWIER